MKLLFVFVNQFILFFCIFQLIIILYNKLNGKYGLRLQ